MKNIFILTATNSYGADVYGVSVHNTIEEAREEMKRQYKEETEKYLADNDGETPEGSIWKNEAELCYNGDEDLYHWQIHTVSLPE